MGEHNMNIIPKYSILIPVLNSIETLPYTIETCIRQQEMDDYEVVVSDNGSDDDIKGLVDSFHDKHLRYYRNDNVGTQADSFNMAVEHAQGEYLLMLGADDSISEWGLYIIDQLLEITNEEILWWNPPRYFWPEREDFPNALWMPEVRRYKGQNARNKLEDVFRVMNGWDIPLLYQHCVIKKSLIERMKEDLEKYGIRLHEPPMADNFQGVMSLLYCKHYLEIPYGVIMMGQSKAGKKDKLKIGSKAHRRVYVDRDTEYMLQKEPFFAQGNQWHVSWLYHVMVRVQELLKKKQEKNIPEISIENLIGNSYFELLYAYEYCMQEGADYKVIYDNAMLLFKTGIERLGNTELMEWYEKSYHELEQIDATQIERIRLRKHLNSRPNQKIECENFGVKNIAEAQKILDQIYLSKNSIDNDIDMFRYSYQKAKSLSEKMKELDKKGGLAIYGIGGHTEILLNVYQYFENDFDNPVIYLDSNIDKRGTTYHGGTVYHFSDIPNLPIAGVVLSSIEFQEVLYGNIRDYEKEIEIIKPYDVGDIAYLQVIGSQHKNIVHV